MPITKPIDEKSLKAFKAAVRQAISLSPAEKRTFTQLNDEFFRSALRDIYYGDVLLAKRVMSGNYGKINKEEAKKPLQKIHTLERASELVADASIKSTPMLLIGDHDNDGSFAQGIALNYQAATEADFTVSPKTYSPAQHSFSLDQIEDWIQEKGLSQDDKFLVLTADIGTNQRAEQSAFIARYPKAQLIITDHHQPKVNFQVEEDLERSMLVSPYMVGELSTGASSAVAGGYILNVVLEKAAKRVMELNNTPDGVVQSRLITMEAMAEASNLLDCVESDIRLKPLIQAQVDKALEYGSVISTGSLGGWVSPAHAEKISRFGNEVNASMAAELNEIRDRILRQNHLAKHLHDMVARISDEELSVGEELLTATALPYDASDGTDYISKIKGPLIYMVYEGELSGKNKSLWLTYAKNVFKAVSAEEKNILKFIREHKLLSERSNNEVVITEPSHPMVEQLFSSKQLRKAHFGMARPVHMSVRHSTPHMIRANIRSSVSIFDAMALSGDHFPGVKFGFNGHQGSGELSISPAAGKVLPADFIVQFQAYLTDRVNELKKEVKLDNLVEVDMANIGLITKINEVTKAVVYGGEERQVQPIVKLSEDLVVMESFSREQLSMPQVVARKPWEYTKFDIDFHDTVAILSNSAIQSIVDSGYESYAKFTQIGSSALMVNDVVTSEQMKRANAVKLKTQQIKEQNELSEFYEDNFVKPNKTFVPVTREEAIEALKFNVDNQKTFEEFESLSLGMMNEIGSDAYVVLDVETADGLGKAAKLTNIGMVLYVKDPASGEVLNPVEFENRRASDSESIKNFHFIEETSTYVINEKLKIELSSKFINEEDSKPLVAIENLTNITSDMLQKLGQSIEETQATLVSHLSLFDRIVFQAHNLDFDSNICASNLPGLKRLMDEHVYLDSALLAKDEMLSYMNTEVVYIEREPYVSGVGGDFNLLSLLRDESKTEFQFPSLKNKKLLTVANDDVYITDRKSQTTNKLSMNREELSNFARFNTGKLNATDVQYGIQKLMKMTSIRDIIENVPAPAMQKVEFDSYAVAPALKEHWDRFQANYGFDQTVTANIAKFIRDPQVSDIILNSDIVMVPTLSEHPDLQLAKEFGVGDALNPSPKKKRTKKAQEAFEQTRFMVSAMDVLKANVVRFVSENTALQNRYSNSWAYLNVLDCFEASMEHVPKDLIAGVSNRTGVSAELVSRIFDETYQYRQMRGGIDSYEVEETHNNVDLRGDAYQEGVVFENALIRKTENQYSGEASHQPAVKMMHKSVALTTINELVNKYVGDVLEGVKLNSFSHKQIEQYQRNDDMMRYVAEGSAPGKLKARNLPDGEYIELRDMSVGQWSRFSMEEREDIETKVNLVVDAIIVGNSLGAKSVSTDSRTVLENAATSPEVVATMQELREKLGRMVVTDREGAMRTLIKEVLRSSVNDVPPKFKMNKSMSPQDLAFCKDVILKGIDIISERVGYDCKVDKPLLEEAIKSMEQQYEVCSYLYKNGEVSVDLQERYVDHFPKTVKSAITRLKTPIEATMKDHCSANYELSMTVNNKKTDPVKFILGGDKDTRVGNIITPTIKLPEPADNPQLTQANALNESMRRTR